MNPYILCKKPKKRLESSSLYPSIKSKTEDYQIKPNLESLMEDPEEEEENLESIIREKYISKINYGDDKIIPHSEFQKLIKLQHLRHALSPDFDPASGAHVKYVDSSFFERFSKSPNSRVLGLYDPNNKTIYIDNSLSGKMREFVYHHEVAHALGIDNEVMADLYAAQKTGYNPGRNYTALGIAS